MSDLKASVIFRTEPLTPEDYKEAIDALALARQQRIEMDAGHGARFCSVCEDSGHTAEQCHHNPLIAARKWAAATRVYACYHCGFVATNDEEAREHFGSNEEEVARCIALPRQDGLRGALERIANHYTDTDLAAKHMAAIARAALAESEK